MAPGTSDKTNPNAMATLASNTIFTNVALTPEGGVWWEGMTDEPPAELTRLARQPLDAGDRPADRRQAAAHPNGRFTAPAAQCPSIDPDWEDRRRACPSRRIRLRRAPRRPPCRSSSRPSTGRPASTSARPWARRPRPRRPAQWARCAAIPWPCCLSAATTWATTSATGSRCSAICRSTPRIFHVNWFRKDENGKFLWPGFGENMRVLKWIVDRVHGRARARRRPSAGRRTTRTSTGRDSTSRARQFEKLQEVDRDAWRKEVIGHEELFIDLHDHLPPEMIYERELLICRL